MVKILVMCFLCLQCDCMSAMFSSGTIDQLACRDSTEIKTSAVYDSLVVECDKWLDKKIQLEEERDLLKWEIKLKIAENESLIDAAMGEVTVRRADFIVTYLSGAAKRESASAYVSRLLRECLSSVKETSQSRDIKEAISRVINR